MHWLRTWSSILLLPVLPALLVSADCRELKNTELTFDKVNEIALARDTLGKASN